MMEKLLILSGKGDQHIEKIKKFMNDIKNIYKCELVEVSFYSEDKKFQNFEFPKNISKNSFDRVELVYVLNALLVSLLYPKEYEERFQKEAPKDCVKKILHSFFKEVNAVLKKGGILSMNDIVPETQLNFLIEIIKECDFNEVTTTRAEHEYGSFCQILNTPS